VGFLADWADPTNPKQFFNEVMNDGNETSSVHECRDLHSELDRPRLTKEQFIFKKI
jgi:hypothetical protein